MTQQERKHIDDIVKACGFPNVEETEYQIRFYTEDWNISIHFLKRLTDNNRKNPTHFNIVNVVLRITSVIQQEAQQKAIFQFQNTIKEALNIKE